MVGAMELLNWLETMIVTFILKAKTLHMPLLPFCRLSLRTCMGFHFLGGGLKTYTQAIKAEHIHVLP